jgi:hypothetical protein
MDIRDSGITTSGSYLPATNFVFFNTEVGRSEGSWSVVGCVVGLSVILEPFRIDVVRGIIHAVSVSLFVIIRLLTNRYKHSTWI